MPQMTDPERRTFLTQGTRPAKLAATRRDVRPHVAPVRFVLDGDDLVFVTAANFVKGRNLRRDGRAALCVDGSQEPHAFVLIEGSTTTGENPDEILLWSTQGAFRCVGEEKTEEYGPMNAGDGMLLVRLTPEKTVYENSITGE